MREIHADFWLAQLDQRDVLRKIDGSEVRTEEREIVFAQRAQKSVPDASSSHFRAASK